MRASEFEAFLRLVDEELSQDSTIVVVGGAASGLAKGASERVDAAAVAARETCG